ncbi:MAG TPA: ferritin-like domain-containing protein [Deltaproteobacteria bacterium]|nr:ferritin-like domain-containing protein [Deltaproteobacteria bacterium]
MGKEALIKMLNRDFRDEHAAVLRYLIHAYQEGEDTVMGAGLLSRSREEMWHMHWLGMIICRLGGEPDFKPGPYPFDPTNRETILQSYIEYEEKLIPHYNDEADEVKDAHIKRVLQREAWESAIHARRFQRLLDKLSQKDRKAAVPAGDHELPEAFLKRLQKELASKYNEMLQHLRISWTFQKQGLRGWSLMDQAMEKMKHLALFAEEVAEDGALPEFKLGKIDRSMAIGIALEKALDDVEKAFDRHSRLAKNKEFASHGGLVMKMDLTLQQEAYQAAEMKEWLKRK